MYFEAILRLVFFESSFFDNEIYLPPKVDGKELEIDF